MPRTVPTDDAVVVAENQSRRSGRRAAYVDNAVMAAIAVTDADLGDEAFF